MFKVKNNLCPPFLSNLFQINSGPVSRKRNIFVRAQVNTVYKGENSLRIFGPIVWVVLF